MYDVSDTYLEEIAKEENTPVTLLKLITGNYWKSKDDMEFDNWTSDTNGAFTVSWDTDSYRSHNHSYKIEFPTMTVGSIGNYGEVSKVFSFDSTVEGLRICFKGVTGVYATYNARLYVDGVLKVEKDLAVCRDNWSNYLEFFESLVGTKTIKLQLYLKTDITNQIATIAFDDLETWTKDDNYFLTSFDQEVPFWDVELYKQGGVTPPPEETYTPFPITVSNMKSSTSGEIEGVQVVMPIGNRIMLGLILNHDEIFEQKIVIIDTFWERRRGAPAEDCDCFSKNRFYVNTIDVDESKGVIVFKLKSKYAVEKVQIPLEPFDRDFCRHEYKGPMCKYAGALADCDKTKDGVNGCEVHENTINFGAFPGIPIGRMYVG